MLNESDESEESSEQDNFEKKIVDMGKIFTTKFE